jgi:zinc protease
VKHLLPLVVVLAACSAAPPRAPKPSNNKPISSSAPLATTPARDPLSVPPASGITPSAPFPAIARRTLASGLEVAVITRKTLPIVELRLLFRSGTASDGPKPGVAAVAGELTKAGGAGPWNAEQLL